MKTQDLILGVGALLLGAVGGGLAGHRMGFSAGETHGKELAQAVIAPTPSKPSHDIPGREPEGQQPSMDAAFRKNIFHQVHFKDNSLSEVIGLLQCRSVENDSGGPGIQITVGHPLSHSPDYGKVRFTYQAEKVSALEILDALSEKTGIVYSIRPCAVLWEKKKTKTEEPDNDEPVAKPADKPSAKDQPSQPPKDAP